MTQSAEEEYISKEEYRERYLKLANIMFGDHQLCELWYAKNIMSMPIRRMAMTFGMSRKNVWKRLDEAQRKWVVWSKELNGPRTEPRTEDEPRCYT